MWLTGVGTTGNTVTGNYIGTTASGAASLGNNGEGVLIDSNAAGNTIGGTESGDGNLISGNASHGIVITDTGTDGNSVFGNLIGGDSSRTGALGNNGNGVMLLTVASGNVVGGIETEEANTIVNNSLNGVAVLGGTRNSIRGNAIHSNGELGIDLVGTNGVTANDVNDVDTGPNNLQNFPVLTAATVRGTALVVSGSLNSTPDTAFDFDFFVSSDSDVSGHGEAKVYVGTVFGISTGSSGNLTLNEVLPRAGVSAGEVVTATATDQNGNTSEFALNVRATTDVPTNNAPVAEAGGPYIIDEGASLNLTGSASSDPDGDTLTYAWDLDNDFIFGEAGEPVTATRTVSWVALVDYGVTNNGFFTIGLQVRDGNGGVDTTTAALTVNNVSPTITSPLASFVSENVTFVQTVVAGDPAEPVTFSVTGGADQSLFAINPATGTLTFNVAPDFEFPTDADTDHVYEVQVTANDGDGGIDMELLSVTVTGVNDNRPFISSHSGQVKASIDVPENETEVTAVIATDADLPAVTLAYTISGGADAAKFAINSSTGVLTFVSAPDFETPTDTDVDNVYLVVVDVSDGRFNDSQAIAVTVAPVNDNTPTGNADIYTVNEGATLSEPAVTGVLANDSDADGDPLTVSLGTGPRNAAGFSLKADGSSLISTTAARRRVTRSRTAFRTEQRPRPPQSRWRLTRSTTLRRETSTAIRLPGTTHSPSQQRTVCWQMTVTRKQMFLTPLL